MYGAFHPVNIPFPWHTRTCHVVRNLGASMPHWYEVYDSDEVLLVTRRQFIWLCMFSVVLAFVFALGMLFVVGRPTPMYGLASVLIMIGGVGTVYLIRQFNQLRQVVWCVKLSDRRIEGYNYVRQRMRMDWTCIRRIELTRKSVQVIGNLGRTLDVVHRFPDFVALSHRIVEYAEFYEIPVMIEGRPWQELDVHMVYPFIEGDEASLGDPS